MGVLACDRAGCSNIMCDILVAGQWYVCNECADEFTKKNPGMIDDIADRFTAFMATQKSGILDGTCTAEKFFENHRRHH